MRRHRHHLPLSLSLALAGVFALSACDVLEYPELETRGQSQQIGPINPELGDTPDLDLQSWCAAQMARDPDPCQVCADNEDACALSCTAQRPGRYICGPEDPDRCLLAEEHCARCELCAAFAPPPTVDPAAPRAADPPRQARVDADNFGTDPKPALRSRPVPSSPFAAPAPPAPEPPPCGLPRLPSGLD